MIKPVQWFLIYSQSCTAITTINFRTFSSSPKRNSVLFAVTPHHSPSSWPCLLQAITYLISVCIDLPALDILCKWNYAICSIS